MAPLAVDSLPITAAGRYGAGLFSDLNIEDASYARVAAERIARLADLADLDQVLGQVHRDFYRMVETLALQGISVRIAKIQPLTNTQASREHALALRRAEIEKIPADLRGRVEAWVKSYYQTKPWLYSGKKKAEQ